MKFAKHLAYNLEDTMKMENYTLINVKKEDHKALKELKDETGIPLNSLVKMAIPLLREKLSSLTTEEN